MNCVCCDEEGGWYCCACGSAHPTYNDPSRQACKNCGHMRCGSANPVALNHEKAEHDAKLVQDPDPFWSGPAAWDLANLARCYLDATERLRRLESQGAKK